MTSAPFVSPTVQTAPTPPRPSSRTAGRVGLAIAMWLIWSAPLALMGTTAPGFVEIYKEFGVPLSGAEIMAMQVGQFIASPLGLIFMLLALPGLCFAVSTLILPPRVHKSPGQQDSARWPLVVIALIGSLMGAGILLFAYVAVTSLPMQTIIQKLNASSPAATGSSATSAPGSPTP